MALQSLDVSQLDPPEPMERILAALANLPAGDQLQVIHWREPHPLYLLLQSAGYAWETTAVAQGYNILIWKADASKSLPTALPPVACNR